MAGLYIHIPFCKSRCIYCDFYSTTSLELQSAYVNQLCNEIDRRKSYLGTTTLDTIYIGGGTPSTLTETNLQRLINKISSTFSLSSEYEFTIEANPGDINSEILHVWHDFGINRISIGTQSFNNDILQFLNRRHDGKQAQQAVELAQNEGFDNISIDLIYGIPNQNMEILKQDLAIALQLDIQHISTYCLTYEYGTQLYKLRQQNNIVEIDDDTLNIMYDYILNELTNNGFIHYEVSNFCKPGMYSRHNKSYWIGLPYLGIGAAAHSYNGHSRQYNENNLTKYLDNTYKITIEEISDTEHYNELVMLGLRTAEGIDTMKLNQYQRKYCLQQAGKYILAQQLTISDNYLKITGTGWHILDRITADLMLTD